ncbi:hypothetical protein L7F22_036006 [Adiantum nelumboides]|nr:hypothetical protein [Adiantum nelumboides]
MQIISVSANQAPPNQHLEFNKRLQTHAEAGNSAAIMSLCFATSAIKQLAHHKFSVNLQRRIYGHATDVEIRPLDPEKAVQAATDILGELVVFSVGVGAVIFEVQRSARSEARKEEARRQEIEAISARVKSLEESFDKFLKGQQSSSTWLPFKQAQSQKAEKA